MIRKRRRLPFWFAPLVIVLVAVTALGIVLYLGRYKGPKLSSENGKPCVKLEDAAGFRSFPAPPCTVVEVTHVYLATLETTAGPLRIVMQPRLAPKSVNNFVFLARAGFYDGTTFHRVEVAEDHAIVQAGDPTGTGRGNAGYTFREDATPQTRYVRGVVAMASSVGAPGVNGSQFFIVVRDWPGLIGRSGLPTETFFGVVEPGDRESFTTLDRIASVPVRGTRPVTPVVIRRVSVEDTSVPPTPSPSPSVS